MRHEAIQLNHSDNGGSQRGRNLRIAHVGDLGCAIHIQIMDLRVEGGFNPGSRTRKVDDGPAGIHLVDRKAFRLQPMGKRVDVVLRQAVTRTHLFRDKPW